MTFVNIQKNIFIKVIYDKQIRGIADPADDEVASQGNLKG